MNYLKKASKTVTSKLKKLPKPNPTAALESVRGYFSKPEGQSQTEKLFKQLIKTHKQIISSNRMSELATKSYDIQQFQQILGLTMWSISKFEFTLEKAYETRNTMIIIGYLLRHGASGFIDQFRDQQHVFQNYTELEYTYSYLEDDKQHRKIRELVEDIKGRAKYTIELLVDKKKMLKEKELSMLVKQKMKIHKEENSGFDSKKENQSNMMASEGKQLQSYSYSQEAGTNGKTKRSKKEKVDDFLENYLYRYINKIDEKIDSISDQIILKLDEYLIGELPENFETDQLDEEKPRNKTQNDFGQKLMANQSDFEKQKNGYKAQELDLI